MKKNIILLLSLSVFSLASFAVQQNASMDNKKEALAQPKETTPLNTMLKKSKAATVQLKNDVDKVSYTLGVQLAEHLQAQKFRLNTEAFVAGLKDIFDKKPLMITRDQMEQSAQQFQKQKQVEEDMQAKQQARQNVIQGEKFLAKNAKQPSVHVLPNGLQYKILTPGVGTHPTNTDQVTVNYTGRLINGEVFDSSYKRGQPITLPMAGVIPGWREALKLMQPGAMWELYIPAKLAYGERGMPPVIGQNQTLIFKVQLLSIQGK